MSLCAIQNKHLQHKKMFRAMLRACCDPCRVQHPTSGPSSLPSRHNNQHHVSATSKLNIYNIKNQCLQHQKIVDNVLSIIGGKTRRNIHFMLTGTFKYLVENATFK
jgi:hypothetical protein